MQKTQYTYEVLVGEDASTDLTRAILQAYEKQHPGKLTVFYRKENMYNSPCSNSLDLKLKCNGKYVIALEGDDFWTDVYKLEKQITFLEKHPEYIAVAHNCVVVDEESRKNGEMYPECKDSEYTFQHFFNRIMPGQLATVMYRNYMKMDNFDKSLILQNLTPGDQLIYFSLLCHGRIYCMQEEMSAYRHVTTHGSSYSATSRFNYQEEKNWYRALLEYAYKHCKNENVYIAEYLYLGVIVAGLHHRQITLSQAIADYRYIHNKGALCKTMLKKKIFRK